MAYTRKFRKGDVIKSLIDEHIDQVTRVVLDKKKVFLYLRASCIHPFSTRREVAL